MVQFIFDAQYARQSVSHLGALVEAKVGGLEDGGGVKPNCTEV